MKRVFGVGTEVRKNIFLFGHCSATEELVDLFLLKGYRVQGILDNNKIKQGSYYRNVKIIKPEEVVKSDPNETVVYIASRAYAAMVKQLERIGYNGIIENVLDCNSFSEYSFSESVIMKKIGRLERGIVELETIREKYKAHWLIVCPYAALGDVYYAMAYLPYYLRKKSIKDYVIITVGSICTDVVKLFDNEIIETVSQNTMDELVQAALYTQEKQVLIAHHDRPYTSGLINSINVKCFMFEELYCCGVFGLERKTKAYKPIKLQNYNNHHNMIKGRTVILSPYAKSIVGISTAVWDEIVKYYKLLEYKIYTNVAGDEIPINGTLPLNIPLSMLQSAVEYAGIFIGIRSGLCDVITNAKCKKIVLFPDNYYSNTKWKVIDFFRLEGWENITINDLRVDERR